MDGLFLMMMNLRRTLETTLMALQSSARLSVAATASFYDWQNQINRGLLKGFDEKNVITERRRVMV